MVGMVSLSSRSHLIGIALVTHQSLGGAVERMPVVSSELGVGSLERRVSAGLRLLDTIVNQFRQCLILIVPFLFRSPSASAYFPPTDIPALQ
jgi:hypothetical protein